jgi:hypothetical protein
MGGRNLTRHLAQGCTKRGVYKGVTRVSEGCQKGVTGAYNDVGNMLQECCKCVVHDLAVFND